MLRDQDSAIHALLAPGNRRALIAGESVRAGAWYLPDSRHDLVHHRLRKLAGQHDLPSFRGQFHFLTPDPEELLLLRYCPFECKQPLNVAPHCHCQAFSGVARSQGLRSPVARGLAWTARAGAPTTRNSVPVSDNADNISTKSWFIERGDANGVLGTIHGARPRSKAFQPADQGWHATATWPPPFR